MLDTYVINRLNQWAIWSIRRQDSGLGYPKQVPYTNLMPRTASTNFSPDIAEECFEVEKCVTELRFESDELYAVIVLHYVQVNMTLEQKLSHLGCCKKTYYNKIDKSHRLILGWLNDLAAGLALSPVVVNFNKDKKFLTAAYT